VNTMIRWLETYGVGVQHVRAQAQMKSWKLPASTPVVTVMAGHAHGGINMPTAEYVIARETIGLM